jgi:Zn-dependent protease with chaperone function
LGFLTSILLALFSLGAVDLGWASEREQPQLVLLAALVPHLLGALTRRLYLAGRRSGAVLERALTVAPLVLQYVAVSCLGWFATVERWTGWQITLEAWPRLRLVLGLLPFFVYQAAAIDARTRLLVPRHALRSARAFQLRMFLSALALFVVYLGLSSVIALVPRWQVWLEEVGLLSSAFGALLLAGFSFFGPIVLRYAWETHPLERGPLRAMLERLAERAGFRCRELLVWRTGEQMSNAAVVGFTRSTRFELFSDLLLAQLGPDELAAVFAHEVGHARRRHALVFAAYACAVILAADLVLRWSGATSVSLTLVVFAAFLAFGYLTFGFLSRRFELEADLESLALVGESGPLVRALELVTGAHAHERASWRHFSTRDRVRFLARAEREPEVGRRLRAGLARWRAVGFLSFAAACALEVHALSRSWNDDRVRVELRLGDYEAALERSRREDVEPELAELARLAAELDQGERSAGVLEERARASLARANLERAGQWLELAVLRGRRDLEDVLAEVDRRRDGKRSGELEGLPPRWRDAFLGLDRR